MMGCIVWWVVWCGGLYGVVVCMVWWVVWCQKAGDRLISCEGSGKTTPPTDLTVMITGTHTRTRGRFWRFQFFIEVIEIRSIS